MVTALKVVQTRLELPLYEALQRTADGKGLSLMDAVREAVRQWVTTEGRFAGSPLFDFSVVIRGTPRTRSSDDDTVLYRRRTRRSSSSTRVRS